MNANTLYHDSFFNGLLEGLEPRIAPAVFIISGGMVVDSQGNDATASHQGDANTVGATKAVLLKKGDSLIVDVDGDGKFTKGSDTLLAQIKGGASLMFFTDTDGSGGIDANEISGLAVSNKFGGLLNAEIHGDVATVLNADLTLNTKRLADDASISKLTINGFVERSITATATISGLTINSSPGQRSVEGIATGNYDGTTLSFGNKEFDVGHADVLGKSTSISKISIRGGIDSVTAGGNFGKGGSVSGVTIVNSIMDADLSIRGGKGFVGEKAAQGGSVIGVRLEGEKFHEISVEAGAASWGKAEYLRAGLEGADGGSVKKISIVSGADFLSVESGYGSTGRSDYIEKPNGSYTLHAGRGGNGGSISGVEISGKPVGAISLLSGNGGDAPGMKRTGDGGSITAVSVLLANDAIVSIVSGIGGHGDEKGGAGGSIQGIDLVGDQIKGIYLEAGQGGNGLGHKRAAGSGGDGGSISKISVRSSSASGDIEVFEAKAGAGGNGSFAYFSAIPYDYDSGYKYDGGKGGSGGAVKAIAISKSVAQSIDISGGGGGVSRYKTDGPSGGSVSGVLAEIADISNLRIIGGEGGLGDSEYGASNGPDGKVGGINVTQT